MSDLFEPIAVVGMAARLPGAADVSQFWRNLRDGRDCITTLTEADLLAAGESAARIADPAYVRAAGLVPGVDRFDPDYFGMTAREAEMCDPQLRLMLETAHQAIEDAGYSTVGIGRDVAVFAACGPSRYATVNLLPHPRYSAGMDFGMSVLNSIDYLATLVSYKFDFRAPSMSVLTACSSSLVAVHLACQSLQVGECDAAVVGAANVELPYATGYRWSPGDVRSPDGRCRPFDAIASGTIFTTGAGAVVLKRLDDAVVDGDTIRGVIRGIGVDNDGSDKVSFSAPSVSGQVRAITEAMTIAEMRPEDVSFVEMHATGTALGDPVELLALSTAYRDLAGRDGGRPGNAGIPVGSVKGNVGHTVAAAGLAGLMKVLLAFGHEELPPTANLGVLNPRLELDSTPFTVNTGVLPWPRTPGRTRVAGLSSLGVGGTNVHCVLAEPPPARPTPHRGRARVVVWSAPDAATADAYRVRLAEHLGGAGEDVFADTVATLQHGRREHASRGALVCRGAGEAGRRLAEGRDIVTGTATDPLRITFAFPDMAAAQPGLAAGLYGRQRVFTEEVDVCLAALAAHGPDPYPGWLADPPAAPTPAHVFAVQYALARQLVDWGLVPDRLVGTGVGRVSAAAVGGLLPVDDAVRIAVAGGPVDEKLVDPAADGAPSDVVVAFGPWRHPAGGPRTLVVLSEAGRRSGREEDELFAAVAALWTAGAPVNWNRIYRDEPVLRVPAPGYPFRRSRFWVDPPQADGTPDGTPAASAPRAVGPDRPALPAAGPFTVPAWTESAGPEATRPPVPAGATCLALLPADDEPAALIATALDLAGVRVVAARPGAAYEPVFGGRCTIRPDHVAEDLDAVVASLRAAGTPAAMVVHAWEASTGPLAVPLDGPPTGAGPDSTLFTVFELVRRAARHPVGDRMPAVLVVTRGAVDVSGGEPVHPARSAVVAMLRSFAMESPGQWCRLLDCGPGVSATTVAEELRRAGTDRVVALRGPRRWVPAERPFHPRPGTEHPIRSDGVYVITGGLGGLGRTLARALARTGRRPRLALLGRDPEDFSTLQAELADAGASARIVACDVADESALERALDEVTAGFGPLHGVFHLAGVPGDGMMQAIDRGDVERVLRPKVAGTLALRRCLQRRPATDFVMCFSSRAALSGMIGGADYAAANAFVDAVAAGTPGWTSVNWPVWDGVGMAAGGRLDAAAARVRAMTAPAGAEPAGRPADDIATETTLRAADCWALDEHRIGGVPVLPGTAVVDLIVDAFLTEVPGARAPVVLREVVFHEPVKGTGPLRVRVGFRPEADGTWRVEVRSGPGPDGQPGRRHATCTAGTATGDEPHARPVSVSELCASLTPARSPALDSRSTMMFGPRWRTVQRYWESADAALAELRLAEPYAAETGQHPLHPALFDVATGLLGGPAGDGFLAPFAYGSLVWYRPVPAHVFSLLRVRGRSVSTLTVDVSVMTPGGEVVVRLDGLRMRWIAADEFVGARPAAAPVTSGLSPEEGLRLLFTLLRARPPARVAVVAGSGPEPDAPAPATGADPAGSGPSPDGPAAGAGPGASVVDTLVGIWAATLGEPDVGPDSDFFDLGGDSLAAVALTGRLRDVFAVELGVGVVFDHPTPREMSELIGG